MLLDRLLSSLELDLWAFSVYEVRAGWQLALPAHDEAGLHFLLAGHARLRWGTQVADLEPRSAIVLPGDVEARIEPADYKEEELRGSGWVGAATRVLDDDHLTRIAVGEQARNKHGLLVACAQLRAVAYGGVGLFSRMPGPCVLQFSESDAFESVFVGLSHEQGRDAPGQTSMMNALMHQALILILRRLCEQGECRVPWLSALGDARLARALDSMTSNLAAHHSLDDLAHTAGMSRSSFASHFTQNFGIAPMEFLRSARMRRATQLLARTDMSIDTIAARVGFSSRSAFSRAFKASHTVDPTQWRRSRPGGSSSASR